MGDYLFIFLYCFSVEVLLFLVIEVSCLSLILKVLVVVGGDIVVFNIK